MDWKDIQVLRKAGEFDQALQAAQVLLVASPDDFRLRNEAEWASYYLIKEVIDDIQKSVKANKKPSRSDLSRLHRLLRTYFKLNPKVPGMALSSILGQLSKVGRHCEFFLPFVQWAGANSLRPEDFQPNKYQERVLQSLAIKLACSVVSWVITQDATDHQIRFAFDLAKMAQVQAKDTDKTWLDWSLAKLLNRMGESHEATKLIVSVLKRKRTESWAWAAVARTYRDEHPDLALSCFCQALRIGGDPKFLGKVHRELAELLVQAEDPAQATKEVLIAVETYDAEGWQHPRELAALLHSDWYDPALASVEPRTFYSLHADEALALCFDEVRELPATFLGMTVASEGKKPKPLFGVRWGDRVIRIAARRNSRLISTLKRGSPVTMLIGIEAERHDVIEVVPRSNGTEWDSTEVREGVVYSAGSENLTVYCSREQKFRVSSGAWIGTDDAKPGSGVRVWGATNPMNNRFEVGKAEPIPCPQHKDIGYFNGSLSRKPRGFGFVNDVFVPAPLVSAADPELENASVVAVIHLDETKQRYGWRAVALVTAEQGAVHG